MLFRFLKNREGVFAPMFAVALVPIIGMVGIAVDYSRGAAVRTSMIAALDSTALMLSKEANSVDATALNAKANAYFNALFVHPEGKIVPVTTSFTELDNKFTMLVQASTTLETDFTRILGQNTLNLTGSSEVKWGFRKLELALVLDNTGSMSSSSKMTELKKASKSLLDTLQKAAKKPDDIKVAIIPFDTTVNIGTESKNDFWITYRSGINKNNWEGCVRDRDKDTNLNYDVLDTPPVQGVVNTYYQVNDCGSLAKAMPLSNDFTALKAKIDQMVPAGMTNVTIGLAWGWHALTGNTPYTNASAPHPELDKVIVMLTDGKNTENRWSTNESSINTRTSAACTNIKAAGIKLYTIRVIDGNASLLQACATQPKSTDAQIKYYHDVDTASELEKVFQDIAHSLTTLRIAK